MSYNPPKHKHTPEAFAKLVDECIAKCKDPEDEYFACPEQLYSHVELGKSRISEYRNAEEDSNDYPYRGPANKWYNFLGVEGWKDLKVGNGKYGQNVIGRILGYTEKSMLDIGNSEGAPFSIVVKPKDIKKDEDQQSGGKTVEL